MSFRWDWSSVAGMREGIGLSRRRFLVGTALMASWAGVAVRSRLFGGRSEKAPVYLFDKVCVQAGLSLDETAALVEATGLDGVDCAVRPGDRIEPARVREDLVRYDRLLRDRGARVGLVTTAILDTDSPHARAILETVRELGVRFYRVGFLRVGPDAAVDEQLRRVRESLARLAEWNRELGLCALVQNHSPTGRTRYLGGDLGELAALVEGFSPTEVAVAFDPGHALLVHGEGWLEGFERVREHLGVVYVKDTDRRRRFVPFGEGELGRMGFFDRLRRLGYGGPFSLHIEYDWGREGRRTRSELETAVRRSLDVLRGWWEGARTS